MEVNKFKGISPVIATILMVMITVGLVAFSYTWFMSMGERAKEGTEAAMTEITSSQAYISFDTLYANATHIKGRIRGHMGNINMNDTAYYYTDRDGAIDDTINVNDTNCTTTLKPGEHCIIHTNDYNETNCESGSYITIIIGNGRSVSTNIKGCTA